jgi:hypothetical protein
MTPNTVPRISPVLSAPVIPPTLRVHPAPTNISSSIPSVVPARLNVKPIISQIVCPWERVSDEVDTLLDVAVTSLNQSPSWDAFVSKSCDTCDISRGVQHLNHPVSTLLHQYKKRGVPVITKTAQWPAANIDITIKSSPHKLALEEWLFL